MPAPALVLFSGGVDSTLIAALLHLSIPAHFPIDLANVSFTGASSPDRVSSLDTLTELRRWAPQRLWRLIEVDSCLQDVDAIRQGFIAKTHIIWTRIHVLRFWSWTQ